MAFKDCIDTIGKIAPKYSYNVFSLRYDLLLLYRVDDTTSHNLICYYYIYEYIISNGSMKFPYFSLVFELPKKTCLIRPFLLYNSAVSQKN